MGTSSAYKGPGGNTPLVPSWLGSPDHNSDLPKPVLPSDDTSALYPPIPPNRPAIPVPADQDRFTRARNDFTRFVHSGGTDHANLGRAISSYISTSSGGVRLAAQRMGSSRATSVRLLSFLVNAQTHGAKEALSTLNLEILAGRSIDEVFIGLADFICPNSGTIDDGIAREAFIETLIELVEQEITDLDAMTPEQMQIVFEIYATHAIEARICNDIGTKIIMAPANEQVALNVQEQLRDFIRNGVSDAFTVARAEMPTLTHNQVNAFVDLVYERAFKILQALGEVEAGK